MKPPVISVTPTILDRALAAIAPRAAAKRLAGRMAFANLARAYDGATGGRRTDGWRTAGTSADTEIAGAGGVLRNRMRDLVRNNPHAAKAIAAWVSNIVGDGFTPYAATGNDELDKRIDALWEEWARECDADGRGDFHALTTLAVREMVESGEGFVRRRRRTASAGLAVPLQIQVMEADHLDESRIDAFRGSAGGRTVRGIEYDRIGRRAAYWMFPDHPGDIGVALAINRSSVRIPAEQIIHLYKRDRVQQRGAPWGSPVIQSLRDLDDWTNAELVRKKTEACLVGVVMGADEGQEGVAPSVTDSNGKVIEQFEPGLIAYARGAKTIEFNQPAATSGVSEWLKAQLHIIAAGFGVPYELLTGDLSEVNFTSHRAGLNEFRRMVSAIQWQVVIPLFCQPVWDWFIEAAWLAGKLPVATAKCEWQPAGFESVNPQADAAADLAEMRMGTLTLPKAIAKRGWNPRAMIHEIADTNTLLDRLGIILDSDPRKVTQQGLSQKNFDNGKAGD